MSQGKEKGLVIDRSVNKARFDTGLHSAYIRGLSLEIREVEPQSEESEFKNTQLTQIRGSESQAQKSRLPNRENGVRHTIQTERPRKLHGDNNREANDQSLPRVH